jgi:hypothetical protein
MADRPGLRPPPGTPDGAEFILERTTPDGRVIKEVWTWRPGPRRRPVPADYVRASDMADSGYRLSPGDQGAADA